MHHNQPISAIMVLQPIVSWNYVMLNILGNCLQYQLFTSHLKSLTTTQKVINSSSRGLQSTCISLAYSSCPPQSAGLCPSLDPSSFSPRVANNQLLTTEHPMGEITIGEYFLTINYFWDGNINRYSHSSHWFFHPLTFQWAAMGGRLTFWQAAAADVQPQRLNPLTTKPPTYAPKAHAPLELINDGY